MYRQLKKKLIVYLDSNKKLFQLKKRKLFFQVIEIKAVFRLASLYDEITYCFVPPNLKLILSLVVFIC